MILSIFKKTILIGSRKPKWVKPMYVELFCGVVIFLFTFLEFNNRNALFVSGDWKYSQTQYVIEWVTLLILFIDYYRIYRYNVNFPLER